MFATFLQSENHFCKIELQDEPMKILISTLELYEIANNLHNIWDKNKQINRYLLSICIIFLFVIKALTSEVRREQDPLDMAN